MAINAKMANNSINAYIGGDTPEEAGTTHAVYFKGDTGPQGPQGPKGDDGTAATIAVGTVTTGAPTDPASVTNTGTSTAAVFDFTIPKGDKGDTGSAGQAATIAVGTVSTVGPTDPATVTNSGTSSAAVFNFEIPKGDKGDQGPKGDDGGIFYAVCDTAGATATKEITLSGVTSLTAGLCVNVKFTYTNSASNPKLQINSLEAKPIYQYGTTAIGTSAATSSWQPGAVVQLIYDGTGFVRDQGYNTNTTYTVDSVLCATGASTAAKVSTNAGYYVLRAGNIFEITFRYTNTKASALTLNVNSTGAKPIYIDGVASSATNYNIPAGKYICYYDGTNYYINTSGKAPINITGKADGNHDIPSGGAAGKVLKKNSATDYDVTWGDADARNIWYATCTTATGTAAKTATSATGDFQLITGAMVRVKFSNSNNQPSATLSVDGTTAKAIKNLPSDSNVNTQWWRAGEVIDLVYDGTDFIMSDGGMASASYYGKTILSNSTSSSSQTTAATSKAVKDAYDLADSKVSVPSGGSTGQALLKTSNSDYAIAWGSVPSGAMYFPTQTVNVASNAEIFRITDASIATDTIVLNCTFANPSNITSNIAWTSYTGYIAFTGTCYAATTADVTLGQKVN